jgi:hypothetical protein
MVLEKFVQMQNTLRLEWVKYKFLKLELILICKYQVSIPCAIPLFTICETISRRMRIIIFYVTCPSSITESCCECCGVDQKKHEFFHNLRYENEIEDCHGFVSNK